MSGVIFVFYIIPAITFLFLFFNISLAACHDLKEDYPEDEIYFMGWDSIPQLLKVFVLAFVPVCNFVLAVLFLKYYRELYEEIYGNAEASIMITRKINELIEKEFEE